MAGVVTHGYAKRGSRSLTYRSWESMKWRCLNPNCRGYKLWGGRGITICESWMNFENFLRDMGERPEGTTLDRIDNLRNYEPGNCRWASVKEQQRNKRSTRLFTFNGESLPIGEWAERFSMKKSTLYHRVCSYGWTLEQALTEKIQKRCDRRGH